MSDDFDYAAAAEKAASLITPAFAKRFRRIANLGPEAIATADVIRQEFLKICNHFGEQAALDIFEHAVESYRLKNPKRKGKPKRLHDSGRDARLVEAFDVILPIVKKGELRVEGIKDPSTLTHEQWAMYLVRDSEGRKHWGVQDAGTLLRRLKEARRAYRTK